MEKIEINLSITQEIQKMVKIIIIAFLKQVVRLIYVRVIIYTRHPVIINQVHLTWVILI
jgi:hypothetical protein